MANLQLSLKRKWFEMTKRGEKKEDYREINEYWVRRFFGGIDADELPTIITSLGIGRSIEWVSDFYLISPKTFSFNIMTLGYPKSDDTDRVLRLEHNGIRIGYGNPEWGAEPNKLYFIIKHGKILCPHPK